MPSSRTRRATLASPLAALLFVLPPATAQLSDLGADILYDGVTPAGTTEDFDAFGGTVAVGDFDHDGYADLAVGVPGETVSGQAEAGAVHVYYGWAGGILLDGDQVFTQASLGIAGTPEAGDHFGAALAVGDFDSNGVDDLIIGVPDEDLGSVADAGMVLVLFGRAGVPLSGEVSTFEDNPCPESGDRYGFSLALGRTSTVAYVAIGTPGRTVDLFHDDAGSVEFLRCTIPDCAILVTVGCFTVNQNSFFLDLGDIADDAESGDQFGWSVATGDFNADGEDDLAIGVPFEDVGATADAGAVHVLYGDGDFFRLDNDQFWHQSVAGIVDVAEAGDRFGGSLAAGHFDGSPAEDLAIGVAGESTASAPEAGGVHVLYGGVAGLTETGDQFFLEDTLGAGGSENGDHFGAALARGDFDGDGADDLAAGVPDENYTGIPNGGRLKVLYGTSPTGLTVTGHQSFDQDLPSGMPDFRESNDFFAAALASGDFDGNGFDDLAIGIPGEDVDTGGIDEGMATILYAVDPATGALSTVRFAGATASFPEEPGNRILFLVREGSGVLSATVDRVLVGGTATAGVDFAYTPSTESWSIGELGLELFSVSILGDTLDEPDETIVLALVDPSAGLAIASPATLTITIVDDDLPAPIFEDGFESGTTGNWSATIGGV